MIPEEFFLMWDGEVLSVCNEHGHIVASFSPNEVNEGEVE